MSILLTLSSGGFCVGWHAGDMIERWSIIFGEVLLMMSVAVLFGLLNLPVWQAIVMLLIGLTGVLVGFVGGELPARNYFQVIALAAGAALVMALGAVVSGSEVLLGVPLTTGSFMLFVIVVAATFFAGFEPEAIEPTGEVAAVGEDEKELERGLAPQA